MVEKQAGQVVDMRDEREKNIVVSDEDLLAQDSGRGLQGIKPEDMAIPFLAIIQSGSPQRKKSDGQYIPGAEEGMVFNSVTNELFNVEREPIIFIPCAFEIKILQWRDRETAGGGLIAIHGADDPIISQAHREGSREILPDGTYLVRTAQHYGLVVYPDGSFKRAVAAMSSTQLKKSRRWLTIMGEKQLKDSSGRIFTPPSYAFKYRLTTQAEQNDKGSWYGWRIEEGGRLDLKAERDVFDAARRFSTAIAAGAVKVSQPVSDGSGQSGDIPF